MFLSLKEGILCKKVGFMYRPDPGQKEQELMEVRKKTIESSRILVNVLAERAGRMGAEKRLHTETL